MGRAWQRGYLSYATSQLRLITIFVLWFNFIHRSARAAKMGTAWEHLPCELMTSGGCRGGGSVYFATLPLPFTINQRTKMGGGLGTRLQPTHNSTISCPPTILCVDGTYIHTLFIFPQYLPATYGRINMIAWLVNTHAIGITKTTHNIIA